MHMRIKLTETVKYVGEKGSIVDIDGNQGLELVKDKKAKEIIVSDLVMATERTVGDIRREFGWGDFPPAQKTNAKAKPTIEYEDEPESK
jgi:hypothetical protein